MASIVMRVEDLNLSFGGVKALDGVSFELFERESLAIVGPNGSGKTSILNVINGVYRPQRGGVIFADKDLTKLEAHEIARLGIGRTFQLVELFPGMTVLDNLLVGCHTHLKSNLFSGGLYWGFAQKEEISARQWVEQIIDALELERYRKQLAANLPLGILKLVGVARALAMKPKVILLDEPASGMNRQEKEDLARFLLRVRYEVDISMIWVEHDIRFAVDLADRIIVLDEGRVIAEGKPEEVVTRREVITAYFGEEEDEQV